MIEQKFHIIDNSGIKWWMPTYEAPFATPYCAEHHLPLAMPKSRYLDRYYICADCRTEKRVPRSAEEQKHYVADKLRAKVLAKMDVINHNGELLPVAKATSKGDEYGVTAQIMESKHGKQLVIYAGKKGVKGKVQLFVDTENGKLAFDHKDLKPTEIFAKVEATFVDGTKMSIDGNEPTTKG